MLTLVAKVGNSSKGFRRGRGVSFSFLSLFFLFILFLFGYFLFLFFSFVSLSFLFLTAGACFCGCRNVILKNFLKQKGDSPC